MKVIATTLATSPTTEETRDSWGVRVLRKLLPASNPDLEDRFGLVRLWWIEIDDTGVPQREIGFDQSGKPVTRYFSCVRTDL